ncbi:MAG: 4-(cytidine 5'-diphospho)-2-C-methyl-D-erythritol kinase [Nitrospinota bacterium]|nr:4-(cytidine 5'-diphospho)-2-C-methyl-D-erythritol kinase [Nitrospinota bacterium]
MTISIEACAKVNLTLKVTGRRDDGYHLLSSVFAKVDLADTLIIAASDSEDVLVTCSHPAVPCDQTNLAARAALALRHASGVGKGATIEIIKRIPVAAGLGGGSSNAAVALAALNKMWGVDLASEELAAIALKLGADVPFFLGGAMAYVEGIGERISPLKPKRSIPVLLANPGFGIRAADAYNGSTFHFGSISGIGVILDDIQGGDPQRVAMHMRNDLEPWALEKYESLARLKTAMENTEPRPRRVVMSGSGPTLMALHSSREAMEKAAGQLAGVAPFLYPAMTLI